ncbi:MAG: regulatory protein RecX [Bacillota bacterium]
MGQLNGEKRPLDYALRVLSRRRVSSGKMKDLMARKGFTESESDACIAKLTLWGYLDDQGYAKDVLEAVKAPCPIGRRRALYELRKRMVDEDLAQAVTAESYDGTSEEALAREAVRKYMDGKNPVPLTDKERVRLARWLERRGFGYEAIRTALRDAGQGDPE